MKQRLAHIDYLRSVYIILMVIFHLAYIGDKYPYAKLLVYTFHMPAFLIISGYLLNTEKRPATFLKTIGWIFVPYAVMECGYITMSAILPVRQQVESLSAGLFADKLFLHPLGPYWYLHTWMLCSLCCYAIHRLFPRADSLPVIILSGLSLWLLSCAELVSPGNAVYFLLGTAIRRCQIPFTRFFQGSLYALIPLCLLCLYPENLDRFTLGGMTITYLTFSVLLAVYPRLGHSVRQAAHFIGRNTLPILLFSPIFTMLAKPLIPWLAFDATGLLFTLIATTTAVLGSFTIAWCMDKWKLSRYFSGKNLLT